MKTTSLPGLLAGVALTGAAVLPLTGGHAQAALLICDFSINPCAPGSQATLGDKTVTTINGPTAGTGIVDFEQIVLPPNGYLNDKFVVDIDYDPVLGSGATADISSTFDYKIAINTSGNPDVFFRDVALNYNALNSASSVTKEVYSRAGFDIADRLFAQVGPGTISFSAPYTELWIRDIITVPLGSQIDNITNTFTQQTSVPAPLPLLGAGAAFGFSRRLRRRSKAQFSLG